MRMSANQDSALQNDRNLQIGNICIQWSHLEYLVALAIWSMLRIDEKTGRILTGGLDIIPRLGMAHQLSVHLNAPQLARRTLTETRKILQSGLLEQRNLVIHGHRLKAHGEPSIETFEVHRGPKSGQKQPLTNAEIAQIGRDIAIVHKALHKALLESGVLDTSCSKPARIMAQKTARNRSDNAS